MAKKAKAPAKSGKKKLTIILAGVIALGGTAAVWYLKKPKTGPDAAETSESTNNAAHSAGQQVTNAPTKETPTPVAQTDERQLLPGEIRGGIIVPLTRDTLAFRERNPMIKGDRDQIMIAELDRLPQKLTEPAEPDRIVVNLANSNGKGIVVLEIGMRVRHLDAIRRINERRHIIFDQIANIISKKTQAESNRGDFKQKINNELLLEINAILGARAVSELVFFRFRLS